MKILLFLAVAIVLYVASLPLVRLGIKRLSCRRSFGRSALFVGEKTELIEIVRNDGPFIIPWLRMESRISPYLRLGSQNNLHVSHDSYYCSLFTLMPYQQIRRTHKVTFLRRGTYNLGNASMTAGDVLGTYRCRSSQNLPCQVMVYPGLLEDEDIPALMSRLLGDLSRRQQLLRDPFMVRGIRPYQPGDPVRDIHWPATARTGETQVRIHDYTTRTRLLVVLNVQAEDVQWSNQLPEDADAAMEYGISLAATMCIQALNTGLAAGFATNMGVEGSKDPVILLPTDGNARIEELLSVFARLDCVRRQWFPAFLETLTSQTGLDILILSLYDGESIQTEIERLRRCGNQVTFHQLEGGKQ